jgi:hypothetical protein
VASRGAPEALVTELDTKRRLRLTQNFWFYDERRHMSFEWAKGSVVSDPADVEWLLALQAPTEELKPEPTKFLR